MSDPASEDEIDDGSTEDVDWEQVQQLRMSKDVQVVENVRVIVRSTKKCGVKRNNLRERTCAEFGEYSKKSDLVISQNIENDSTECFIFILNISSQFAGQELNLIQDVKTRWSSLHTMLERFTRVAPHVHQVLRDSKDFSRYLSGALQFRGRGTYYIFFIYF